MSMNEGEIKIGNFYRGSSGPSAYYAARDYHSYENKFRYVISIDDNRVKYMQIEKVGGKVTRESACSLKSFARWANFAANEADVAELADTVHSSPAIATTSQDPPRVPATTVSFPGENVIDPMIVKVTSLLNGDVFTLGGVYYVKTNAGFIPLTGPTAFGKPETFGDVKQVLLVGCKIGIFQLEGN